MVLVMAAVLGRIDERYQQKYIAILKKNIESRVQIKKIGQFGVYAYFINIEILALKIFTKVFGLF